MSERRAAGEALAVPDPHRSARAQVACALEAMALDCARRSCHDPGSHGVLVSSRGHGIADTGPASLEVKARASSTRRAACPRAVPSPRAAAESPPGPSPRPPPRTPRPAHGRGPRRGRHRPCIAGAGTRRGRGSRAPSRAARAERETLRRAAVRARGPDGAGAATAAFVRARGSSPPRQPPAAHPNERARRRAARPARTRGSRSRDRGVLVRYRWSR
jgi:hypothetical protein